MTSNSPEPMAPSRRRTYAVINSASAPLFLAMILAPRSRLTRRMVARAVPLHATLGVAYGALLASGALSTRSFLDFRDPERLRHSLGQQDFFLAGWSHYITFDLFVGQWIWQDALDAGRSARVALLLTWLGGPVGLTLYLTQRQIASGRDGGPA